MRWEGREESRNVDDRRRLGKKGLMIGGGGAGLLIIVVLALCFGADPQQLAQIGGPNGQIGIDQGQQPGGPEQPVDPAEERLASFSKVVFRDTEIVWDDQFRKLGKEYRKPTLVLYNGVVESACGTTDSAVGPFYCPGDYKVYIDLGFYQEMERKLKAPGEFARAYVIAHEVGHHVQNLLGFSQRVQEARLRLPKDEANEMSVRLELQADYLAGVWAHHAQTKFNFLEEGDIEAALNAAFQIGDDTLQRKSRGYVVPDAFTHGTSKQRMRWFTEGLKTGKLSGATQLFELRYNQL
jgi:predicted metalloprotease